MDILLGQGYLNVDMPYFNIWILNCQIHDAYKSVVWFFSCNGLGMNASVV